MKLTEQDREALIEVLVSDEPDVDEEYLREYVGPVADQITPAVEAIVARHVNEALEQAAQRVLERGNRIGYVIDAGSAASLIREAVHDTEAGL